MQNTWPDKWRQVRNKCKIMQSRLPRVGNKWKTSVKSCGSGQLVWKTTGRIRNADDLFVTAKELCACRAIHTCHRVFCYIPIPNRIKVCDRRPLRFHYNPGPSFMSEAEQDTGISNFLFIPSGLFPSSEPLHCITTAELSYTTLIAPCSKCETLRHPPRRGTQLKTLGTMPSWYLVHCECFSGHFLSSGLLLRIAHMGRCTAHSAFFWQPPKSQKNNARKNSRVKSKHAILINISLFSMVVLCSLCMGTTGCKQKMWVTMLMCKMMCTV